MGLFSAVLLLGVAALAAAYPYQVALRQGPEYSVPVTVGELEELVGPHLPEPIFTLDPSERREILATLVSKLLEKQQEKCPGAIVFHFLGMLKADVIDHIEGPTEEAEWNRIQELLHKEMKIVPNPRIAKKIKILVAKTLLPLKWAFKQAEGRLGGNLQLPRLVWYLRHVIPQKGPLTVGTFIGIFHKAVTEELRPLPQICQLTPEKIGKKLQKLDVLSPEDIDSQLREKLGEILKNARRMPNAPEVDPASKEEILGRIASMIGGKIGDVIDKLEQIKSHFANVDLDKKGMLVAGIVEIIEHIFEEKTRPLTFLLNLLDIEDPSNAPPEILDLVKAVGTADPFLIIEELTHIIVMEMVDMGLSGEEIKENLLEFLRHIKTLSEEESAPDWMPDDFLDFILMD